MRSTVRNAAVNREKIKATRSGTRGAVAAASGRGRKSLLPMLLVMLAPKKHPAVIACLFCLAAGSAAGKAQDSVTNYVGSVTEEERAKMENISHAQRINPRLLMANDAFLDEAGYQLSQFRFRVRGYDSRYEARYINGIAMNEQVRGVFNYASIGALNDLTKNTNRVDYLGIANFGFGSIGGAQDINMRPADYAQGWKVTISGTHRTYYLRGMLTFNSGLLDNGWAFTASIGGRYAHEGAIPGTFYHNAAYAVGIEKRWGHGEHSLSLISFGSPVERGQQGSSVKEALELAGTNLYNPNWGYQNGKKRNARVVKSWDPTLLISYEWKPNRTASWTTGLGVHYNRYGQTSLNWYNGYDPRPDYYRYLPSYLGDSVAAYEIYKTKWKNGELGQIQWDKLYEINQQQVKLNDGKAVYMLQERRSDLFEASLSSTYCTKIGKNMKLCAGILARYSLSRQFTTVNDLLGAKYVLDIDKFAERDFPGDQNIVQSDLNKPNRKVQKGDIFGYNYQYHIHSENLWAQMVHSWNSVQLYYGLMAQLTGIARRGLMKNGHYPDNSFGMDKWHLIPTYGAKTGAHWMITGQHVLSLTGSFSTEAPLVRELYVSPEITNQIAGKLEPGKIANIDLSYRFSTPYVAGRLSAFYTWMLNGRKKVSYYHDTERSFVHHTLYGVNREHRGVELGIECKPLQSLTLSLVGTAAQYYYSNNPRGVLNSTNGKLKNEEENVIMKNLYIGGLPQIIGTFGVGYFYRYWFFDVKLNGFGYNHIDPAPIRRLASNYTSVAPPETGNYNEKRYNAYVDMTTQERFKPGLTIDLSIGKIIYLPNRQRININASISNILNKKDIITGGYEQGRISLDYPHRFPNKHYYMMGIDFFINASYSF